MQIIRSSDENFSSCLKQISERGAMLSSGVEEVVKDIIEQVRKDGDAALRRLTERFDGHTLIEVPEEKIRAAKDQVEPDVLNSLEKAFERIEDYHRQQIRNSWMKTDREGEILGQMIRPLCRVGIYVPGGKALYPSSVLMNAIPARVAGVKEIVMVTPCSTGSVDPVLLAAADMCGIKKVYQVGGAQAVAAMAYGTETIPRVDKITGPGNIYVATAKRLVYGLVDIDMIAGPSEILVLSDGSGSAECVAADMLSQAEHDEMASAVLVTTDETFAESVKEQIEVQLKTLPGREIAERSIGKNGLIVIVKNISEAVDISNEFAPEHLELYLVSPWDVIPSIQNAGAVFVGHYCPEAVGDYIAGPNHVLPTGGSARFFSPLSVDDFIKKTSLIFFSPAALKSSGGDVICLARSEQLFGHAGSVEKRLKDL